MFSVPEITGFKYFILFKIAATKQIWLPNMADFLFRENMAEFLFTEL